MIDWKILAASFVALLVISSVFIGGFGIRDMLSDLLGKVTGYLGASPLDNVFPSSSPSEEGEQAVALLLYKPQLTLTPDAAVTITAGDTVLKGFTGTIDMDFENQTLTLTSNDLTITFPLREALVESLTLATLDLEDTKFEIPPDLTTDSGTIHLSSFSGRATITPEGLHLEGSLALLRVTIGENQFELV